MYRILSLDGGGSWSILQLLMLKRKHGDITGHELLKKYDLVVANSGGSIVLAALCENMTLSQAQELFDKGEFLTSVFSKTRFKDRFFPADYLRIFNIGPKYSSVKKKEAFERTFKEVNKRQMIELPEWIGKPSLKLMVATYDALNNRAKFFKSFKNGNRPFDSVKLTQAIHGSSNAPIQYFDFPSRFKAKETEVFYELWDGALGGFNNPIAAGICEALKHGVPASEIHVISLGTARKIMTMKEKKEFYRNKDISVKFRSSKLRLGKLKPQLKFFKKTVLNQAQTILFEPPDWANYVSMMLLFQNDISGVEKKIVRISPLLHLKKDQHPVLEKLHQMDMDLTAPEDIKALYTCFELFEKGEINNQPLDFSISRENKLIMKRGHRTFKEALLQWDHIIQ